MLGALLKKASIIGHSRSKDAQEKKEEGLSQAKRIRMVRRTKLLNQKEHRVLTRQRSSGNPVLAIKL